MFVERVWRSVKYERVYLKAYDNVSVARADIANYIHWREVCARFGERLLSLQERAFIQQVSNVVWVSISAIP